jgi:hypothetical protein
MLARVSAVLFAAVLLAGCGGAQKPAAEQPTVASPEVAGPDTDAQAPPKAPGEGTGTMIPRYEDATSPAAQNGRKILADNKFLEEMAGEATDMLELPYDIPLIGKQCDEANAYWSPSDQAMTICYEDADAANAIFVKDAVPDPTASTLGAERATFYHELGHATIDIYDLPFTGREEDVADQLAAVLLLEPDDSGKTDPQNVQAAVDWARIWQDSAEQQGAEDFPFWDAHEYDLARMYNFECWIYGSNPEANAFIVDDGTLPEDRAGDCPDEWDRMSRAWDGMLDPYWKQ